MEMLEELQDCQSLKEVVSLINTKWACDGRSEQFVAEYVVGAAKEYAGAFYYESLQPYMDCLRKHGAKFSNVDVLRRIRNMPAPGTVEL